MFDDPVVVFVEESEDLSEVLGLLLHQLVEDVELGPLDGLVVVEIVSSQQGFLDFDLVEVLDVLRVGGLLDVAGAFLDHLDH